MEGISIETLLAFEILQQIDDNTNLNITIMKDERLRWYVTHFINGNRV